MSRRGDTLRVSELLVVVMRGDITVAKGSRIQDGFPIHTPPEEHVIAEAEGLERTYPVLQDNVQTLFNVVEGHEKDPKEIACGFAQF